MSKKGVGMVLRNQLKMIKEYSLMFCCHPLKYNFNFYLTRIIGAVRTIFIG